MPLSTKTKPASHAVTSRPHNSARRQLACALWTTPLVTAVTLPVHGQASQTTQPSPTAPITNPPVQTLFDETLLRQQLCGAGPVETHWLLSIDGTAPAPQSLIVNGPNNGPPPAISNGSPGASVEIAFDTNDNIVRWVTGGSLNQAATSDCGTGSFDSGIVTSAMIDSLGVSHTVEIQYINLTNPAGGRLIVHSLN